MDLCTNFGFLYSTKVFRYMKIESITSTVMIYAHKFWISVNAEVQNFCVSFDRYMKIEKGVVDVFWIIMIVFCSTVNMDLCTQILDFCECRSTKFLCKF